MHACFSNARRSWKTISVFLTETNNPSLTLPVSWTACLGADVGGVPSLYAPTLGPLTGSEFYYDKGETHLHLQAVYSPTLY